MNKRKEYTALVLDTLNHKIGLKATFWIDTETGYFIKAELPTRTVTVAGKVSYQYGKGRVEEEQMDCLEFIARVTSHIPDKGQVMIRYYGLYANAHRGKIRKKKVDPSHRPLIEDEPDYVSSKGWAEMIKKVYEANPLMCPKCGAQMALFSFIEDHKGIDKIIRHLKLTFYAERPPPPQVVQQELLMAAEEREEYF